MTVLSWSLEFIAGMLVIGYTLHSQNPASDDNFILIFVIIDACLNFILIPSSYILNNEVVKTLIIAEGWCRIFRGRVQANKVNPALNNVEPA